jgi:hypothetical protein
VIATEPGNNSFHWVAAQQGLTLRQTMRKTPMFNFLSLIACT